MPATLIGRDGKSIAAQAPAADPCEPLAAQVDAVSQNRGLPNTPADFERFWRKHCQSPAAARAHLLETPPATLRAAFRVELKSTVLKDILNALASFRCSDNTSTLNAPASSQAQHPHAPLSQDAPCEQLGGDASGSSLKQQSTLAGSSESAQIVALLQALCECGRFELARKLVPTKVLQQLDALLLQVYQGAAHDSTQSSGMCRDVQAIAEHFGRQIAW